MSQKHEVYVIYYDGEPIKGNRAAYHSQRDARTVITYLAKSEVPLSWREENAEKVEAERKRYTVVPYIAKEVSE